MLNTELLSNLVTWAYADHNKIEELLAKFPQWGTWDQADWAQEIRNGVCQTAYCMAGAAVADAPQYRFNFDFFPEQTYNPETMEWEDTGRSEASTSLCYKVRKNGKDPVTGAQRYRRVGDFESISVVAQELLGITYAEANYLFNGNNDIEDIVGIALELANHYGVNLNLSSEIVALHNPNHTYIS